MDSIKTEMIKDEIKAGLEQVDDSLVINDFSCDFDSVARKLYVTFTASNDSGDTVSASLNY